MFLSMFIFKTQQVTYSNGMATEAFLGVMINADVGTFDIEHKVGYRPAFAIGKIQYQCPLLLQLQHFTVTQ